MNKELLLKLVHRHHKYLYDYLADAFNEIIEAAKEMPEEEVDDLIAGKVSAYDFHNPKPFPSGGVVANSDKCIYHGVIVDKEEQVDDNQITAKDTIEECNNLRKVLDNQKQKIEEVIKDILSIWVVAPDDILLLNAFVNTCVYLKIPYPDIKRGWKHYYIEKQNTHVVQYEGKKEAELILTTWIPEPKNPKIYIMTAKAMIANKT